MEFQVFLPIAKVDEEKRMVWGYASTPTKDLQGEVVTLDAIKAALPDYMQWANIREMHTSSAVGVAKEATVDEKGLYIGAKIVDNDAWQKCKEQVYKGFSIGGSKVRKVGDTIEQLNLREISLVDRPANPDCRIEVVKAAGITISPAANQASNSPFDKFLDICKSLIRFGHDGFSAPANILESPTHFALEGHQPQVIAARVDNSDKHPSNAMQVDLRQPGAETPGAQRVELTHDELSDLNRKMAEVEFEKREFSEKQRKHLAAQGLALPDGSYPIASEQDLRNAIHAVGRAADYEKAKAHIIARAKAMKLTHLLPADWPGSTNQEKSVMNEDLQKRLSAALKGHIEKAHYHLKKAAECHSKACEAFNNLHKCFGKAAGANPLSEHVEHMKSLHQHLSDMEDHHQLAHRHLQAAKGSWTGESGEAPTSREGSDVSVANAQGVDLLPQSHLTEGSVRGSNFQGAGDSPYSAAAIAAEVQKAVTAATSDLTKKLGELTQENSYMKGQMSVIEKLPAGGPKPRLMTGSMPVTIDSLGATDTKAAVNTEIMKAYQGIDPNDPETATRAAARIIGLRALHGTEFGKKITDPDYRGGAGK